MHVPGLRSLFRRFCISYAALVRLLIKASLFCGKRERAFQNTCRNTMEPQARQQVLSVETEKREQGSFHLKLKLFFDSTGLSYALALTQKVLVKHVSNTVFRLCFFNNPKGIKILLHQCVTGAHSFLVHCV